VTILLLVYAVPRLDVDTDTSSMFSERLAWRRDMEAYRRAFPRQDEVFILVVEASDAIRAEDARARLAERLSAEPGLFHDVYLPGGGEFFERHGLLYLDLATLEDFESRLTEVAPFVRAVLRDPDLRGVVTALDAAAEASGRSPALARLVEAAGRALTTRGGPDRLDPASWFDIAPVPAQRWAPTRRVILAQPRLDPGEVFPADRAMTRIRELRRELGLEPAAGYRVRVTGKPAMANEELRAVGRAVAIAMASSLLMVLGLLLLALRSARLVVASLATLVVGLAGTAGFAAWAVGQLNLISIAFAILYIGMGIDYSIHLCLRWRELRSEGRPDGEALEVAAADVGGALFLCAVTTAGGFYAFLASDLTAAAELGIIAGTGMFVGLFATLTVLPALITLLPPAPERVRRRDRTGSAIRALGAALPRHRTRVLMGALLLAIAALLLLPRARFDAAPLHLLNPEAESVAIYRELLKTRDPPPLTISVLERDSAAAAALAGRLARLDVVAEARTLESYVPRDQEAKLAAIARLRAVLGLRDDRSQASGGRADLDPPAAADPAPAQMAAFDTLRAHLELAAIGEGASASVARSFLRRFGRFHDWLGQQAPEERAVFLAGVDGLVAAGLGPPLARLEKALDPEPVAIEDLPRPLRERWVAVDGRHRIEAVPRENLDDTHARRRFVEGVRAVAPHATGLPVVSITAGDAVVDTFRRSFLIALAAITAVLVVLLRGVRNAALVLVPLLLAGLLTVASAAALDVPFDYANVIALPLLLGIGVDNGIHVVRRARMAPPADGNLLATSTSRAVVYSGLTTIASFGNLMISRHAGMASMGFMLTVGMTWSVLATIVVLPALLARSRANEAAGRADPTESPGARTSGYGESEEPRRSLDAGPSSRS